MRNLNWDVRLDRFEDTTPYGSVQFTNIIATLDPKAKEKFVLACHYDSKYFPVSATGKSFLGAIDSAGPCAMMIDSAVALKNHLKTRKRVRIFYSSAI